MKTHSKTALAAMILILVVATAATAATALAGERKRLQQHTAVQVAQMANQGSLNMLRSKIRAVRVAFAVPR